MFAILIQSVRQRMKAIYWWMAGSGLYIVLVSSAFPTLKDQKKQLEALMDNYPAGLKAVFGITDQMDMFTGQGYLQAEAMGFYVPLIFILCAIIFGAHTIAGEEHEGITDLLLSLPIGRIPFFLARAGSLVIQLFLLALAVFLGMMIGSVLFQMDVSPINLAAASLDGMLLGVLFGVLAMSVGAVSGSKGLAAGLGGALALAAFLLNSLATLVTWLSGWRRLSPFYWYAIGEPLYHGPTFANWAVLIVIAIIIGGMGMFAFSVRDLKTS